MPPITLKTPGVYVEEVSFRTKSIMPAETGCTAFLGRAMKGTYYRAVKVTSMHDFVVRFGALHPDGELGYAAMLFFANGGSHLWVVRMPVVPTAAQWQRGLEALAAIQTLNLLALPGVGDLAAIRLAGGYATKRRAFLLLDPPATVSTVKDALDFRRTLTGVVDKNAALYFPWVKAADDSSPGGFRLTAPSGAMAGVIVRVDLQRGVWKAPAGTDAAIEGITGFNLSLKDADQDVLNPEEVNCLRMIPPRGALVWGSRTLSVDPEWRYIPVRRLALYLEQSLDLGLQWVVLEPNDAKLWTKVRATVENFLMRLFQQGALSGSKPAEAYFVKCDTTTMTAVDLAAGKLKLSVGFAPLKPAEFILLSFTFQTVTG